MISSKSIRAGILVAIATAPGVSADVEHRRKLRARLRVARQVKISCDVKMRPALEVKFLDAKPFFAFKDSRDHRLQGRSFRQWPQPEHIQIFPVQFTALRLPLLTVRDAIEKFRIKADGLLFEEALHHRLRSDVGDRWLLGCERR